MNEEQERLLERYRDLWTDYNATADLMEKLEAKLREIKAEQRRLANKIASTDTKGLHVMDEKEALGYAANILRTMAAQDPENSVYALRAARMLDSYFTEEGDGDNE